MNRDTLVCCLLGIVIFVVPARGADAVVVTSVSRSIQAGAWDEVVSQETGSFNKELSVNLVISGKTIGKQEVRQNSGPDGNGNLWKADSTTSVTPVETATGNGAWSRSKFDLQFTVTTNIACEFTCSVDGDYSTDNVLFTGPASFQQIHIHGSGGPRNGGSGGRRVLLPGVYHLQAECYAQGSSSAGHRAGEFHFDLKFYSTCGVSSGLPAPPELSCGVEISPPVVVHFSNGQLEYRCEPSEGAFIATWTDFYGPHFIGICRYNWGENFLGYEADPCQGTLTKVLFQNHEGHVKNSSPRRDCPDLCHGMFDDLYEIDEYVFQPEPEPDGHLQITKRAYARGSAGEAGPPRRVVSIHDGPAPLGLEELKEFQPPHLQNCAHPQFSNPVTTLVYLSGLAVGGHVFLNVRDRTVALWLRGGETPNTVASRLAQLINSDTNWTGMGATAVSSNGNIPAFLMLTNVIAEDLSITVTGQGTNGVRFVRLPDIPLLETSRSATDFTLSWPTNALGFVLETTGNPADAPSWTSVAGSTLVTNGMNRLTLPLGLGSRFFRLRLP